MSVLELLALACRPGMASELLAVVVDIRCDKHETLEIGRLKKTWNILPTSRTVMEKILHDKKKAIAYVLHG